MLSELAVEDYQSIKQVFLWLGQFTVVTGPTGSGKSALFRAIQLLAFNARGTSYIRQGARSCLVRLEGEEPKGKWEVTISRGARGSDYYSIAQPAPVPAGGYSSVGTKFTKLGGQVPWQVSYLHGLTELNFASQFDRPFLLADSAGEVARTLGTLTGITVIFEAAREAQRRRKELLAQERAAEAELGRLAQEKQRFAGLRQRLEAVTLAETAMKSVQEVQAKAARLRALLGVLEAAEAKLQERQAVLREAPDLSALEAMVARAARLRDLLKGLRVCGHNAAELSSCLDVVAKGIADASAAHASLLAQAGICPVCGQPTSDAS